MTKRVSVAPLRYGGGMKGKVVEAMRFALPCVTSPAGAQGFEDEVGLLQVADTPEEFAAATIELLKNDVAWLENSKRTQAYAQENFSKAALWKVLAADVDPSRYESVADRLRSIAER